MSNINYYFQQIIPGSGLTSKYIYSSEVDYYYAPSYGESFDINNDSSVIVLGGRWDKINNSVFI